MGGKRAREAKKRSSSGKPKAAARNSDAKVSQGTGDEEYVAYASDGSNAAELAEIDSGDDASSSDGNIPLVPLKGTGEDGEDKMSDIEVSFEFFDPVAADATTVGQLVQDYARDAKIPAHDLAAAIVEQTTVGTTVKITDEPAPVAFVSCLNMRKHRGVLSGLLQKLDDAGGTVGEIARRGSDGNDDTPRDRIGLILTERVLNLPPVLVAKMQEAIFCEIEWATEDEKDERDRESFRFAKFLYITDAYCKPPASGGEAGSAKRRRKDASTFTFARPEDEAWLSVAEDTVTWGIEGELVGAEGLIRRRLAMVVHSSRIPTLREKTCTIVGLSVESQDGEGPNAEKAES